MKRTSAARSGEMHLLVGLSAIALVGTLAIGTTKRLATQATITTTLADVAVEHRGALTLRVTASAGKDRGIVELSHDGNETVHVSVPDSWERREVRGAALDAATGDPAALGFRRWTLPSGAVLSFWVPDSPSLRIHNPEGPPFLVLTKRVNLKTGSVDEDSVFVDDRVVTIWEEPKRD